MRKLLITLIVFLIAPVGAAQAALVFSSSFNEAFFNQLKTLDTIIFRSDADGEFTAEHGINVLMTTEYWVLWDASEETAVSGPAIDQGYVDRDAVFEYLQDFICDA